MLCAGVTTYAALRRSQAKSGQWVVISGAGGGLGKSSTMAYLYYMSFHANNNIVFKATSPSKFVSFLRPLRFSKLIRYTNLSLNRKLASRGMALRVIGIDAGSKEKLVRDCGAEHFIDVTKHDDKAIAEEVVKTAGGLGASAVIV